MLVLALVMGSFSMAFGVTSSSLTDIEDSANADAIAVVNDLGVVTGYPDGTFKGENPVTRAEFAAMITRALALPESALAGFTTTEFTDAQGHWAVAYLGYCASKGIIAGYPDGTVKPNATITVNEAITMVCRALGYVAEAKELVGTWPANYVALAQSLGLYDDMAAQGTIDRQNAAQLIYNALNCDLVYIDADGKTEYVNGKKGTMLQLLGGVERLNGDAFVLTSDLAEKAIIDVKEFIGSNVKAFVNDKTEDKIIAIEVLSTTITGKYKDGEFTVGDAVYYLDAAKVTGALLVENGKTGTNTANAVQNNETITIAVDFSGKTISKVYSETVWDYSVNGGIFSFEEEDLDAKKGKLDGTYSFKMNNDNEIDIDNFILNGVAALADIEEDDIVTVYTAGGFIVRVDVCKETVTGTVAKVDGSDYYINGTKYNKDANCGAIALGDTGTARLTYAGDIYDWDKTDDKAGNYAIVVKVGETEDAYQNKTVYATLFTKEGKEVEYVVHKDTVSTAKSAATKGAVYTYSLDKNGKLNGLTVASTTAGMTTGVKFNGKHTLFGNTAVNDNAFAFVYDTTDKVWSLGSVASIDADYAWSGDAYKCNVKDSDGKYLIFVGTTAMYGTTSTYGVINAVDKQIDADGNGYWHVDGLLDGAALSAFTLAKASEASPCAVTTTSDALQKITVDADGIVTEVTPSGITGSARETGKVTAVDTAKQFITISSTFGYEADVVVYLYDADEDAFVIGDVAKLKNKNVIMYNTDTDNNEGFDIIVAW